MPDVDFSLISGCSSRVFSLNSRMSTISGETLAMSVEDKIPTSLPPSTTASLLILLLFIFRVASVIVSSEEIMTMGVDITFFIFIPDGLEFFATTFLIRSLSVTMPIAFPDFVTIRAYFLAFFMARPAAFAVLFTSIVRTGLLIISFTYIGKDAHLIRIRVLPLLTFLDYSRCLMNSSNACPSFLLTTFLG